jgi:hypothetical protein
MTKELTAFAKVRYSTNSIGALLNCLRRDNADASVATPIARVERHRARMA